VGFNIEATNNRNDGFHIVRSEGNVFHANTAAANDDDGFDLDTAIANLFISSVVHENRNKGFNLEFSVGNFFLDNTSNDNGDRGFRVSHGSRYNPFVGNMACHNKSFDFEENSNPNFFRRNVFSKNVFCTVFGIRPGEEF